MVCWKRIRQRIRFTLEEKEEEGTAAEKHGSIRRAGIKASNNRLAYEEIVCSGGLICSLSDQRNELKHERNIDEGTFTSLAWRGSNVLCKSF